MQADKSKTYYIAGPMTGIPQFNVPAFELMALRMRGAGYKVVSPAELDSPEMQVMARKSADGAMGTDGKLAGETWADVLARDVKVIADTVDAIVVLDGWAKSRGARLEVFVALLCGKPIFWDWAKGYDVPELLEVGREVIVKAIAGSFSR